VNDERAAAWRSDLPADVAALLEGVRTVVQDEIYAAASEFVHHNEFEEAVDLIAAAVGESPGVLDSDTWSRLARLAVELGVGHRLELSDAGTGPWQLGGSAGPEPTPGGLRRLWQAAGSTRWKAMVEGRDHLSGDSFIMVTGPNGRLRDLYVSVGGAPGSAAILDVIAAAHNAIPRLTDPDGDDAEPRSATHR
jgi:hypothetical protein